MSQQSKKAPIIVFGSVLLVVALAIGGYFIFGRASNGAASSSQTSQPSSQAASSQQTGQQVRFADTQYANYAYLISGNTISSNAQAALAGFQRSVTVQADGSQVVTLKALNPNYQNQQYTVQPGQQLYFIETSFGDDRAPDGEYSLGDDGAVLVDQNGYIVGA